MQARLSVDILNREDKSKFVRVSRGRFTLRSRLGVSASDLPHVSKDVLQREYIATRRALRLPAEEVLCVSEESFKDTLTFQGIETDTEQLLPRLLASAATQYIPRAEAESRDSAKQFITYVLVQSGQRILCFRRSYLSRAAEFLRGSKCIGFGGHVTAADEDILSHRDRGLSECARRELTEELTLPDPIALALTSTSRLFREAPLEVLGVLNDDSSEVGRRHVAVVYRVWLNDWQIAKHLQKGDSSLKGLAWLDLTKDKVDLSDYEYWSQLCLRTFFPSNVVSRSGFKVRRRSALTDARLILVTGRIGSGKTETSRFLSQHLGIRLIRSSDIVRDLMKSPSVDEIGRLEFQRRASEFMRQDDGAQKIAVAIDNLARHETRCIVDGIRNLSTFENLSTLSDGNVATIHVQTPPDVAHDLYRNREDLTITYRQFLRIYDDPVEQEISSLGREADIFIYNAFGIEAFRRTLVDVAMLVTNKTDEDVAQSIPRRAKARERA